MPAISTLFKVLLGLAVATVVANLFCYYKLKSLDVHVSKSAWYLAERQATPPRYLINPANNLCINDEDVDILALVTSSPENVNLRHAIRKTWGRELVAHARGRVAFVLGRVDNQSLLQAVKNESQTFDDIIQGDFVDSYYNLTTKSIAALHWAVKHCSRARFIAKFDDDVFLNVRNFVTAIQKKPRHSIYGHVHVNDQVDRNPDSKWFVSPQDIPEEGYPDFVSGSAYIVGGEVVELLYKTALAMKPFWLEDVFITGFCAEAAGIPRVPVEGFNHLYTRRNCEIRRGVMAHYVSPETIFLLEEELHQHYFCWLDILNFWSTLYF